jgi:hypothetical protein
MSSASKVYQMRVPAQVQNSCNSMTGSSYQLMKSIIKLLMVPISQLHGQQKLDCPMQAK